MARPADPNSKRQRGFKLLNRLYRSSAAVRISRLMSELDVTRAHAETINATHRRMAKKEGKYVTTYRVSDHREGKPCSPHLVSHDVYKTLVNKKHCLTPAAAKAAYTKKQQAKINLAKVL